MKKMLALRDYLNPYGGIEVKGTVFEHPDDDLCEYLVETNVLAYAPEEENETVDGKLAEAAVSSDKSSPSNTETLAPAKSK